MLLDDHRGVVTTADGLERCLPILVLLHLFVCHLSAAFAPFAYLLLYFGRLAELVVVRAPRAHARVR